MNRESLGKFDVMSVAEGIGVTGNAAHQFVDEDRKELNMLYHFEGMSLGYLRAKFKRPIQTGTAWSLSKNLQQMGQHLRGKGWGTIFLGNHDQPRMVTRWGMTIRLTGNTHQTLSTFLLTMRGTPYYYFGDELGEQYQIPTGSKTNDIESINTAQADPANGGATCTNHRSAKISARDNGRTPFQWDSSLTRFYHRHPWLKVNPSYTTVNVSRPGSWTATGVLHYFRKLIRMRGSPTPCSYMEGIPCWI